MKKEYLALSLLLASSLCLFSCKKDENGSPASNTEPKSLSKSLENLKLKAKPELTKLSPQERAAKLGFSQYLPNDTQAVVSIFNARESSKQLKALKLFQILEDLNPNSLKKNAEHMDTDSSSEAEQADNENTPKESDVVSSAPDPWTLLGQEITISFGKSTEQQVENLSNFSQRIGYLQAKAFGKAIRSLEVSKGIGSFAKAYEMEMGAKLLENLANDEKALSAILDTTEMPPLMVAFRAKDGELEQAAQLVSGSMMMFAMAGEIVAPFELETAGAKFSGYKLLGEKVAQMMKPQRQKMETEINPEIVQRLFDTIERNNIHFATGTIGNYVVIAIGSSEDALKLCPNINESLLAKDELSFADAYANKKLVSMIYGEKTVWNALFGTGKGIYDYAIGFNNGISAEEDEAVTREIDEIFQIIVDRKKILTDLANSGDFGLVAYSEDGLKIKSIGGYDDAAIDYETPTKLAHLADKKGIALFYNGITNPAFESAAKDYAEAVTATLYSTVFKLTDLNIKSDNFNEFKKYADLFDSKLKTDSLKLYAAINKGTDALESETAIVVDLKGSLPALAGLTQEFIDEAKAPRITILSPIKDRKRLATTWVEINTLASTLLNKIGNVAGTKIPMQKPISSEKGDMTTWFYSLPFLHNDFMPSITLTDSLFAASSSKKMATSLITKAKEDGDAGKGTRLYVNFNLIHDFSKENLAVMDKHSSRLFSPSELESYRSVKPKISKLIDAMKDFDSLNWTVNKENGIIHSSLHLKVK